LIENYQIEEVKEVEEPFSACDVVVTAQSTTENGNGTALVNN
jgi:hypothetical protein